MSRHVSLAAALLLAMACAPRPSDDPAPAGSDERGGAQETIAGTGPAPELPPPDTAAADIAVYSTIVPWPAGRTPVAPPGFHVSLFADGLQRPRWLYVLPNGDLLVAESANSGSSRDTLLPPEQIAARWASGNRGHSANRITLLRDANHDGMPELRTALLWGLNRPVGMLYLDGWLYVANTDELVRYPFRLGDTSVTAPPRRVLELPAAATTTTGPGTW